MYWGRAQRRELWRGEKRRGGPSPRAPSRHRRSSLEILALAGPAVLKAVDLENPAGPGEPPKGSGQRALTLRDPGGRRLGLPEEARGGRRTAEGEAKTKKRGAGSSRTDHTSRFAPVAEGRPSLHAEGWREEPRGGGAAPPGPSSGAAKGSSPRAPGARSYAPRAGRGRGRRGERSRRELQQAAVIELSQARPSTGCSPPTQPFIHPFVSPTTQPTLLSNHVSDLLSVH